MNIVLIDYGVGNIKSITNAFKIYGITPNLTRDKDSIINSDGLILPGVGAFSHGMNNLRKFELVSILKELNKPLLGICLGMQLLFDESEEFTQTEGLGLIKGKVIKLPSPKSKNLKLPNIGWRKILKSEKNWKGTILENLSEESNMYFVHSYAASPKNNSNILSLTEFGEMKFCSSVKHKNVYGCQFHPEKSANEGLKIVENFIKICKNNH
tara:strand:- start:1848 stop:2480 length:633 start_codon:yes stop_codon:yes gene_type:complete